jgi:hypothetical protein
MAFEGLVHSDQNSGLPLGIRALAAVKLVAAVCNGLSRQALNHDHDLRLGRAKFPQPIAAYNLKSDG